MEEDFDLNLSPTHLGSASGNKSAPKKGRRANLNAFGESRFDDNNDLEIPMSSPLKSRPQTDELFLDNLPQNTRGGPPLKGRRRGGWSDDQIRAKTAKSVRIQSAAGYINNADDIMEDDDDGDIPIIPDLDDVQDEDMALQVAEAPSVAVNRVATYKELDNELLKHVAFATVDDIDLRSLTKCMVPEMELREKDEMWSWDILFAEITGELQKEWFPDQEEQEKMESASERPYTAFNRNFNN